MVGFTSALPGKWLPTGRAASASVEGVSTSTATGRRLTIVAVCVVSLLVCSALAWWQWERFASAGGTFQNLGYVLQWPLFGLFPAFMFWRMRRLNRTARQTEASAPGERAEWGRPPSADVPAPRPETSEQAPRPDDEDPQDAELAAYNRYLAELNARDQEVK